MSGLASLLKTFGKQVSGSDSVASAMTKSLMDKGISVNIGHKARSINKNIDAVIYSVAIKEDNPELIRAKKLGIPCFVRGKALGFVSQEYKNVIAVAGMHGKTTTTAMLYHIFKCLGKNPTLHIGGEIDNETKNIVIGGKDFFITEACEYGDSFLYLKPTVSIINNIEKEHLDYFGSLRNIYKSFNKFMCASGKCFVNSNLKGKIVTLEDCYFGKENTFAQNICKTSKGYEFDVILEGEFYGRVKLNVEGKYNIHNCLGALLVAEHFGFDKQKVLLALESFHSVKRRFERVGKLNNLQVIFDYAHHPTEIKNSIRTAKSLKQGKVFVFFQPHTYSRTKFLSKEFSRCFKGAEEVFVCSTYKAREKYDKSGDEKSLASSIRLVNGKIASYGGINEVIAKAKSYADSGVMLFVGAGDMQNIVQKELFGTNLLI